MFLRLLILFTVIPLIELYLLIRVGQSIGALYTIAIVLGTAIIGANLTRQQGARTLLRIRESLSMGKVPAGEIVDAVLIFIAGVLLITPGFITDTAGFLLLVPRTRSFLKRRLNDMFRRWIEQGRVGWR